MRSYAEQFFAVSQSTLKYPQPQAEAWKETLMQGCKAAKEFMQEGSDGLPWEVACGVQHSSSIALQSLALLCPESCGCKMDPVWHKGFNKSECPSRCFIDTMTNGSQD